MATDHHKRMVEKHRENIMKKLDVHSVAELTRISLTMGLLPPR